MRTALSLLVLIGLGVALYRLWPSQVIGALRDDPNVVLRAPWQDAPPTDPEPEPAEPAPRVSAPPAAPPPGALRVLFVGNSHTHYNDMPEMIAGLAAATPGARPFFYRMEAPGGARLVDQVGNGRVASLLAQQAFDHVVLQEQQQWPSFKRAQRQREFEAPARTLDVMIRAAGARTFLFMTWARRDGDRDNRPSDTYAEMQARVRDGYADASRAIEAPTVAVGLVWQHVLRSHPDLALWNADGSHPSLAGSYLAACVFYKAFYERSPLGNPYDGGLSDPDALRLQHAVGMSEVLYAPGQL